MQLQCCVHPTGLKTHGCVDQPALSGQHSTRWKCYNIYYLKSLAALLQVRDKKKRVQERNKCLESLGNSRSLSTHTHTQDQCVTSELLLHELSVVKTHKHPAAAQNWTNKAKRKFISHLWVITTRPQTELFTPGSHITGQTLSINTQSV